MKIIINADDFGLNSNVNKAIIDSFNKEICSSTTIMSNGEGFKEACELAHMHRLNKRYIGVHINLWDGTPLTDKIRYIDRFCNEQGFFDLSMKKTILHLNNHQKNILACEIRAQIQKCIDNNISVTHLDSHHHVHTQFGIYKVIYDVAKEFKIDKIRISRNYGRKIGMTKLAYKKMLNLKMKRDKFKTTKYFGDIEDYIIATKNNIDLSESNVIEIMIHPQYDIMGNLIDLGGQLLEERIKNVSNYRNSISYAGK